MTTEKKSKYLPCLFRILGTCDFLTFRADFTTDFSLSIEYVRPLIANLSTDLQCRYPFLSSFLEMEEKLKEVRHLIPLIQWTNINLRKIAE